MKTSNPSLITIAVLFTGVFIIGKAWPDIGSAISPAAQLPALSNGPEVNLIPVNPLPELKPVELPPNGDTHYYQKAEAVAPFSIMTESGRNYFAKLVDKNTGQVAMTIFVRGGQTVKTKVPLGSYEFRYASGTQWYGEEHLFGPGTNCQKAAKVLDFCRNGTTTMGHTVQLIKRVDGNLPTTPMNRNSF